MRGERFLHYTTHAPLTCYSKYLSGITYGNKIEILTYPCFLVRVPPLAQLVPLFFPQLVWQQLVPKYKEIKNVDHFSQMPFLLLI